MIGRKLDEDPSTPAAAKQKCALISVSDASKAVLPPEYEQAYCIDKKTNTLWHVTASEIEELPISNNDLIKIKQQFKKQLDSTNIDEPQALWENEIQKIAKLTHPFMSDLEQLAKGLRNELKTAVHSDDYLDEKGENKQARLTAIQDKIALVEEYYGKNFIRKNESTWAKKYINDNNDTKLFHAGKQFTDVDEKSTTGITNAINHITNGNGLKGITTRQRGYVRDNDEYAKPLAFDKVRVTEVEFSNKHKSAIVQKYVGGDDNKKLVTEIHRVPTNLKDDQLINFASSAIKQHLATCPTLCFNDGLTKPQLNAMMSYCNFMGHEYTVSPMQKLRMIAAEIGENKDQAACTALKQELIDVYKLDALTIKKLANNSVIDNTKLKLFDPSNKDADKTRDDNLTEFLNKKFPTPKPNTPEQNNGLEKWAKVNNENPGKERTEQMLASMGKDKEKYIAKMDLCEGKLSDVKGKIAKFTTIEPVNMSAALTEILNLYKEAKAFANGEPHGNKSKDSEIVNKVKQIDAESQIVVQQLSTIQLNKGTDLLNAKVAEVEKFIADFKANPDPNANLDPKCCAARIEEVTQQIAAMTTLLATSTDTMKKEGPGRFQINDEASKSMIEAIAELTNARQNMENLQADVASEKAFSANVETRKAAIMSSNNDPNSFSDPTALRELRDLLKTAPEVTQGISEKWKNELNETNKILLNATVHSLFPKDLIKTSFNDDHALQITIPPGDLRTAIEESIDKNEKFRGLVAHNNDYIEINSAKILSNPEVLNALKTAITASVDMDKFNNMANVTLENAEMLRSKLPDNTGTIIASVPGTIAIKFEDGGGGNKAETWAQLAANTFAKAGLNVQSNGGTLTINDATELNNINMSNAASAFIKEIGEQVKVSGSANEAAERLKQSFPKNSVDITFDSTKPNELKLKVNDRATLEAVKEKEQLGTILGKSNSEYNTVVIKLDELKTKIDAIDAIDPTGKKNAKVYPDLEGKINTIKSNTLTAKASDAASYISTASSNLAVKAARIITRNPAKVAPEVEQPVTPVLGGTPAVSRANLTPRGEPLVKAATHTAAVVVSTPDPSRKLRQP